jgi:hypothetical protein
VTSSGSARLEKLLIARTGAAFLLDFPAGVLAEDVPAGGEGEVRAGELIETLLSLMDVDG